MNPDRSWARRLAALGLRAAFTLAALHVFGILWRPLLIVAALVVAAAVVMALAVVAARLALFRWRGW